MSFNISTLSLSPTAVVHLSHPADEGTKLYADKAETKPITITIFGRTSKEYREWAAKAARKQEKLGKKVLSLEEVANNTADFLTAITKSVANIDLDGEALDNPVSIKKMYMKPELDWIGAQVATVLGEQADFLAK